MRTRECRKYQLARIRRAFVYVHTRHALVHLADGGHVRKVKSGVNALGIHIHADGNNICIAGALAVAEKGALNAVRARKNAHFAVCHSAAAVVMRMKRYHHVFAVV